MNAMLHTIALAACCAIALPAAAQTAAKPAAKPSARKAAPKPASKAAAAPKPAPLPPANDEQMAAARMAYLGVYDCEFNQTIQLIPNPLEVGYIDVAWKKEIFVMKPVLSSTGALRLEDTTGRTLMIQIANKSMLMDTRIGQRLVDECIHPTQRAAIEASRANPAPPGSSLGIDPVKTAAMQAAQAASAAASGSAPAVVPPLSMASPASAAAR